LGDFLLGGATELGCEINQNLGQPLGHIVHRQTIHLLISVGQRLAKQFQQLPQQVRISLHCANNLCIGHRNHFASLERHRAIGPEHVPAHGELSDNFSSLQDVINDFVPVLGKWICLLRCLESGVRIILSAEFFSSEAWRG
jgi:hypothetical protein